MAAARKKTTRKTIKPGKDITESKAQKFKEKLLKAIEAGKDEIVLDFSGVKNIDSIGLGIIISSYNNLKIAGIDMTLNNLSDENYKLFSTLGMEQFFKLKASG